MKSKNLITLSVWSAISIIFVLLTLLGVQYSHNPTQWLIWIYQDWLIVFIIALIFTGVVVFFKKEPEIELQSELQSIGSKLDALSKEVEEIKKVIAE